MVAVLEAHDDGRVADGASPALSLDCAKPLAAPLSLDDSVSADRASKKRQVCSTNTSTITLLCAAVLTTASSCLLPRCVQHKNQSRPQPGAQLQHRIPTTVPCMPVYSIYARACRGSLRLHRYKPKILSHEAVRWACERNCELIYYPFTSSQNFCFIFLPYTCTPQMMARVHDLLKSGLLSLLLPRPSF